MIFLPNGMKIAYYMTLGRKEEKFSDEVTMLMTHHYITGKPGYLLRAAQLARVSIACLRQSIVGVLSTHNKYSPN